MRRFDSAKKVIAVLLFAICLMAFLSACNSKKDAEPETTTVTTTTAVPTTASTSTPTTQPPQSTTVEAMTDEEQETYGANQQTRATQAYRTTVRQTYRTTQRVVRTTASYNNDAGCLDDDAMTY